MSRRFDPMPLKSRLAGVFEDQRSVAFDMFAEQMPLLGMSFAGSVAVEFDLVDPVRSRGWTLRWRGDARLERTQHGAAI